MITKEQGKLFCQSNIPQHIPFRKLLNCLSGTLETRQNREHLKKFNSHEGHLGWGEQKAFKSVYKENSDQQDHSSITSLCYALLKKFSETFFTVLQIFSLLLWNSCLKIAFYQTLVFKASFVRNFYGFCFYLIFWFRGEKITWGWKLSLHQFNIFQEIFRWKIFFPKIFPSMANL